MSTRTWTTLELLRTTTEYLAGRERPEPRLAAERLLAHALGCRRVDLYLATEKTVDEEPLAAYRGLVRAYAAGEPMQYVIGEAEFLGLPLLVDRRALIPRPETEILVDALIKRFQAAPGPIAILEMGVGSGAIAVALAVRLVQAEVWATDVSPGAAALAGANARRHGVLDRVHVMVMDRFSALSPDLYGTLSCLVSNPPYVTSAEMLSLPDVVRDYEPHVALHGGPDGLEHYRFLCSEGLQFLAPGGTLAVEIGAGQGAAVRDTFEAAGLGDITLLRDYAGLDRVVLGKR